MKAEEVLDIISQYGKNKDGSFTRLGFSEIYFIALGEVEKIFKKIGLNTWIDPVGNLHGLLKVNPEFKTILVGSHLDTVPNGGLYDGAMGIALAVSAISRIIEENIDLNYNIELVAFNAEEGGAMGGTFGSRAMMGLIDKDNLVEEDMLECKITRADIENSEIDLENYLCYIEAHIEQGSFLESENLQVGIVDGVVGISRYNIVSHGKSNHSGATPMKSREDALYIMSLFIKYSHETALALNNGLVSTIGELEIIPGTVSVIPGKCKAKLEVRYKDQDVIDTYIDSLQGYSDFFLKEKIDISNYIKKASVESDHKLVKIIEDICKKTNISHTIMTSGAGHDASSIALKMPAVMFFLPSKDGISHNKDEFTSMDDINIGEKLFMETLIEINKAY